MGSVLGSVWQTRVGARWLGGFLRQCWQYSGTEPARETLGWLDAHTEVLPAYAPRSGRERIRSIRGKAIPRSRTALWRALLLLVIVAPAVVLVFRANGNPTVIIVGPGGFASISAAIAAASPGDIVRVSQGIYHEEVEIAVRISVETSGNGPVWVDGDCTQQNGFRISASGVSISGVGVRRTNEAGIRIDGADDVSIDGVTVQDFNCDEGQDQFEAGIAVWDGGARLSVTNSAIIRRVELSGSARGFGNGIWIKNVGAGRGGGHYIANNTIIGGYDGIGGEPEDAVYGGFYRDSIVERNTIDGCWDDGIQMEGGNINVVIRDNRISGCGVGIALAPTKQGPLYIERNQIRDLVAGFYGQQAAFKLGDNSSGRVFVTDNVVATGGDGFKQTNSGSVGTIESRRNTVNVSRRVIEMGVAADSDFDEDCLWSTDPNRFIIWNGRDYQDLVAFRRGEGQEMNGVEAPDCGEGSSEPPLETATPPPTTHPPPPPSSTASPTPAPTPTSTPTSSPTPTPTATPTRTPNVTSTVTVAPDPTLPRTPPVTSGPTPGPSTTPHSSGPDIRLPLGDVDDDSDIDAVDALLILRHVAGFNNGRPVDVNCDGKVGPDDALVILRFVSGLPVLIAPDCPFDG